jgi:hypothetical protein
MEGVVMKFLYRISASEKITQALMPCVARDFKYQPFDKGGTGLSSSLIKLKTKAARKPPPKQAIK